MEAKPNIYIMSDLHFDTPRSTKQSQLYSREQVQQNVASFVNLLSTNKENSIFVLAGDFFDDLFETLYFIKLLEQERITSFVVLGNHDYWSKSQKRDLEESLATALEATENNHYCRLLATGRKYRIGDLIFIGDSGFTDFKSSNQEYSSKNITLKDLGEHIPDIHHIKDFNTAQIRKLNQQWVKFATKEIEQASDTESLFVVTHWPMDEEGDTLLDSWWYTDAKFPKARPVINTVTDKVIIKEKLWLISGHTHRDKHNRNSIAVQAGYRNAKWFQELTLSAFGSLVPTEKLYSLVDPTSTVLQTFTDFSVVERDDNYPENAKKITTLGYKRAGNSDNKKVIAAYLKDRERYIKKVRQVISNMSDSFNGTGYTDVEAQQSSDSKTALLSAINVLEAGYQNNPFEFFTALIVSGYAYNNMIFYLSDMRKVNVYDIIRQAMVFQTVMAIPELTIDDIRSIRSYRGKNSAINIGNIDLKIPTINGHHLDSEVFLPLAEDLNKRLSLGNEETAEKRLQLEHSTDSNTSE